MPATLERIRNRLEQLACILKSKVYAKRQSVEQLLVSDQTERISYSRAQQLSYRPAKMGRQFGPLWTTYWFKGNIVVPPDWSGGRVDLIWVAHYCESTLWMDGQPVQGLNYSFGQRCEATLVSKAKAKQNVDFEIEMACNTTYGAWPPEKPYESLQPYVLDKCEVGLFDPQAWKLYMDFLVLQQLEVDLAAAGEGVFTAGGAASSAGAGGSISSAGGDASERAFSTLLLSQLVHFADTYNPDDIQTWATGHRILQELLQHRNGSLIHEISATGEGHLDMAWLWPVAETRRKIVRTTTNQLRLMEAYPEYKFACSQAYFYHDLKAHIPKLYQQVKARIKSKQWIPVGGMWVESDCNLPSGESLVRQFLYGQRFFKEEFGFRASECWLQDAFGFNAQLPQLMKLAGINRFVTQKLLWVSPGPQHRLFHWQGLDGSTVLAHFPPRNTFSADLTVASLRRAAAEYPDDEYCARSLMSYGLGDGGGGPTALMVELLMHTKDLQGVPRTQLRSPSEFFELVEKDIEKKSLPSWSGELYFPRHRGTYTSQAATKKAMQDAERLLHDVEFLSTLAWKGSRMSRSLGTSSSSDGEFSKSSGSRESGGYKYPSQELNRLWKIVLLNQFHDILPGTSIQLVHEEAVKELEGVAAACRVLRTQALDALSTHATREKSQADSKPGPNAGRQDSSKTGPGINSQNDSGITQDYAFISTTGFPRREICTLQGPNDIAVVDAPAYGAGSVLSSASPSPVTLYSYKDHFVLENEHLVAEFSNSGDLLSLLHRDSRRAALSAPGNIFKIYDDRPVDYDAWELEAYYQNSEQACPQALSCKTNSAPLRAEIVFERRIGQHSSLVQAVRLDALSRRLEFHCQIDWHEEHKLLRVYFPVKVTATHAAYATQFGTVERPTHQNLPYDAAQFEVSALNWVDVSEPGFGVALLTDYKYGFSVHKNVLGMSLLRAPVYPDPTCDRGEHTFAYALMPHTGSWQEAGIVAESAAFTHPLICVGERSINTPLDSSSGSFVGVDSTDLVIETIKKAEDSNGVIVRLYECHGARGTATARANFSFNTAHLTNLLEDRLADAVIVDGAVQIHYEPFQIITLLLS